MLLPPQPQPPSLSVDRVNGAGCSHAWCAGAGCHVAGASCCCCHRAGDWSTPSLSSNVPSLHWSSATAGCAGVSLLLFLLALLVSFCMRNSDRVGSGQSNTMCCENFKKKKRYSAITAIPQRPLWLWRPPYETRNATAIWWRVFENPRRHTAMALL